MSTTIIDRINEALLSWPCGDSPPSITSKSLRGSGAANQVGTSRLLRAVKPLQTIAMLLRHCVKKFLKPSNDGSITFESTRIVEVAKFKAKTSHSNRTMNLGGLPGDSPAERSLRRDDHP